MPTDLELIQAFANLSADAKEVLLRLIDFVTTNGSVTWNLSGGVSIEQFCLDLAEYFRNVLFLKHGIRRQHLLGYPPDQFSAAVVDGLTSEQLEKAVELLLELYDRVRNHVHVFPAALPRRRLHVEQDGPLVRVQERPGLVGRRGVGRAHEALALLGAAVAELQPHQGGGNHGTGARGFGVGDAQGQRLFAVPGQVRVVR